MTTKQPKLEEMLSAKTFSGTAFAVQRAASEYQKT